MIRNENIPVQYAVEPIVEELRDRGVIDGMDM